jgi:hypothetical protein
MASSLYIYDERVYYYFFTTFYKYSPPSPPFWRFTLEIGWGAPNFQPPTSPHDQQTLADGTKAQTDTNRLHTHDP